MHDEHVSHLILCLCLLMLKVLHWVFDFMCLGKAPSLVIIMLNVMLLGKAHELSLVELSQVGQMWILIVLGPSTKVVP